MNTPEDDERGLELAELPLKKSNQHQRQQPSGEDDQEEGEDYDDQEGEDYDDEDEVRQYDRRRQLLRRGETDGRQHRAAGDRAPLLARDSGARAARRERRTRKREAEASLLRRQLRLLWKTLCGLLSVGALISAAATLLATVELRRHLGRIFFALPLMLHFLLDAIATLAPLLAAENDGEGEPPPPRPTSQVEFQRQLRTGRRTLSTHLSEGCCRCEDVNDGANEACRLGASRGLMAAIVLGYVVLDAINCAFLGAGFVGGARGVGVEADGTVAPERRGAHAALTAVGALLVAAMGVRVLLSVSIAAYLRTRSRLKHVLRGSEPPWHYTMSPRMQRLAVRQAAVLVAGATLLLLVGAGSYVLHSAVNTGSDRHFDRCDPLDATLCALPFPSSYFLEEEASSPTGYKVSFGPRSLPYTRGRKNVSPDALNAFDGFSTLAPILFYLEASRARGQDKRVAGVGTKRFLVVSNFFDAQRI